MSATFVTELHLEEIVMHDSTMAALRPEDQPGWPVVWDQYTVSLSFEHEAGMETLLLYYFAVLLL